MSQSKGGKAATVKGKEEAPAAPAPEQPPQPRDATRAEKEEIVYLNLSELFPFKDHPFGVRDDAEMKGLVESVKGLLSEERFATLSLSLEAEQKQLKMAIPAMEASLDATTDKAADLQRFIERARQVTRLTELTPEIVHEFIEKIVVSKPDKVDGERHQRVDIQYNTIGLWCAPSPEEMEKLFQEHLAGQHKKTA